MSDTDYDELRKKNIAERNAVFAEFFSQIKSETKELKSQLVVKSESNYLSDDNRENEPPRKRRKTMEKATQDSQGFRSKRVRVEFQKKYNTRSRASKLNRNDDCEESDNGGNRNKGQRLVPKGRALQVMFSWARPAQRDIDVTNMDAWDVDKDIAEYEDSNWESTDGDDDDENDFDGEPKLRKRQQTIRVTKSAYNPESIPSPDEITDAMLKNVATRSTDKIYSKIKGISCHQCRQKTMDTKTVCRSGECIGVRGQFCGPCLRGRYGEDAVIALKDPNWACPPCRGLCNCSICRTRNGKPPTGILAPFAQEEGFASVMDYLRATGKDEPRNTQQY